MNRNTIAAALRALAVAVLAAGRTASECIAAVAAQASRYVPGMRVNESLRVAGRYVAEYVNPDGSIGWRIEWDNLVTTAGKNHLLDTEMAGSAYTAAWYLGLITATGYTTGAAAGDTMSSHGGWSESTAYSNATRVAVSWNAASAGSKASTTCAFNINATDTIKGAFLTTGSAKSGTTGTLYSAGTFSGGDQAVSNGGTLNVTYTASA